MTHCLKIVHNVSQSKIKLNGTQKRRDRLLEKSQTQGNFLFICVLAKHKEIFFNVHDYILSNRLWHSQRDN